MAEVEPSPRGMTLQWHTPIQYVPGVGESRRPLFERLGIGKAGTAVFFFPRDYEQPAVLTPIGQLREGVAASVVGVIDEVEIATRASGRSILGVLVTNETGAIRLVYFNQPYRMEHLQRGSRVLVSGEPRLAGFRWEFVHPKVTILDDAEPLPDSRILPVYSLVEGLKQSQIRKVMATIVDQLADQVEEALDEKLRSEAGRRLTGELPGVGEPLLGITAAIRELHRPTSTERLQAARNRLVFQELLVMQLATALKRRQSTTMLSAPPLATTPIIDARIKNRFPFALTGDQELAMQAVAHDMARQFPMNRMVQGDVGSGKTVIAQYAMLLAVAHRHQAVLMAPTEVLARQHYELLSRQLSSSRVQIGLLCGSLTSSERKEVLRRTQQHEIDVLVGTQALLYGEIEFAKLGLCVIDEQHKFGVEQRQGLRRGALSPHCLVLTATPIPRTITMSLFGDLDVSLLKQKPSGRGQVHTYLSESGWRDRWWKFVKQKLDEGRQAFVIAPRISTDSEQEESSEESSSVVALFDELRRGPLADYRLDLLHGRLTTQEKNAAMQRFATGKTQVLVSTTVIEVGIDVPNATVMTIMGAERFGLAQLHQLRGRVARSAYSGHVCLFTDKEVSPAEVERLQVLASTNDGFEIAEADYRLRGPGDLVGTRQSGMANFRIADPMRDESILLLARELAMEMVDADPSLAAPSLQKLKRQMLKRYQQQLQLSDVG